MTATAPSQIPTLAPTPSAVRTGPEVERLAQREATAYASNAVPETTAFGSPPIWTLRGKRITAYPTSAVATRTATDRKSARETLPGRRAVDARMRPRPTLKGAGLPHVGRPPLRGF